MICSRCGTNNSKTSKFCRECGNRLSELLDLGSAAVTVEEPDDQVVSDMIYEALKLYEHGSLEDAFQKCRQALVVNPSSSSARSLLALIYEKKSSDMAADGDIDDARDYLSAAIRQLELVLEANPDSDADREKLNTLRAKMIGPIEPKKAAGGPGIFAPLVAWISSLPPAVIGVGTVVIVFLLILLIFRPHNSAANAPSQQASAQTSGPKFAMPPQQAYPPQGAGAYPSPQPAAPAPPAQGYVGSPPQQPVRSNVPPIPSVSPPVVTPITPLPVPGTGSSERPRTATPATAAVSPTPTRSASLEEAQKAYSVEDYPAAASILENAISSGADSAENNQMLGQCYYNMGRGPDAVSKFERAIQLYTDRKARGENAAAADQGIRTCKQFIGLARE